MPDLTLIRAFLKVQKAGLFPTGTLGDHVHLLRNLGRKAKKYGIPAVNGLAVHGNAFLFGIEIGANTKLGYGVEFVHPRGTIIGTNVEVGHRVRFYGGNVLGDSHEGSGQPIVGEGTVFGHGAKAFGPVKIGRSVRVGANAVLVGDIEIGDNAVIGPNEVVRTSIPTNGRYVGGQVVRQKLDAIKKSQSYHV